MIKYIFQKGCTLRWGPIVTLKKDMCLHFKGNYSRDWEFVIPENLYQHFKRLRKYKGPLYPLMRHSTKLKEKLIFLFYSPLQLQINDFFHRQAPC